MGKIALHLVGLHPATETLASGNHVGCAFQSPALQEEDPSVLLLLLVGDHAFGRVEHIPRSLVSHSVSASDGLLLRIHRGCQHLHVHFRRYEVVYRVQIRTVSIFAVSVRGSLRHALQRGCRKRRRYVGIVRKETQVLRC